jgi:ribosomal protein S18 acetylase RimI-like enzyme
MRTTGAPVRFRDARPDEADAIARFHFEVRAEAFGRFLPPELARVRTAEERAAQWGEFLADPGLGRSRFLTLAEEEAVLVGFVAGGPTRRPVPGYDAQIHSIYVRGDRRGRGIGERLLRDCAHRLGAAGYARLSLFTPEGNEAARRFYERLGGHIVQRDSRVIGGTEYRTIAYGWDDFAVFGSRAAPGA